MRPRISKLATRLLQTARANQFAVCALVLVGLSAVLVPQNTRASGASRDATLGDMLRYMRTQIQVYQVEHGGKLPGAAAVGANSTADAATFVAQMTLTTDAAGNVVHGTLNGRVFGPYVPAIPQNPFTSRDGILIVPGATFPPPDNSQPYGWMYSPSTGRIVANVEGVGADGVFYANY